MRHVATGSVAVLLLLGRPWCGCVLACRVVPVSGMAMVGACVVPAGRHATVVGAGVGLRTCMPTTRAACRGRPYGHVDGDSPA